MKLMNISFRNSHFLTYYCFFIFLFFASTQLNAQVGINNTNPKASLDISASNPSTPTITDGLLVPRVSNFPSPVPTADQNGMLIYLTTTVGVDTPGFYYWNQATTSWLKMVDENAVASQNWDRTGTTLSPETAGDDLSFANNEHITLDNAFSTPDAFIYLYSSISGSNVERTIFRENPSSIVDFSINPGTNAFLFKSGTTNAVTIDVDNTTPLDVNGSISLGNVGSKYTLPNNNGNNNDLLISDGAGVTSWQDFDSLNIGYWNRSGNTLSPETAGDDLSFANNEHITLDNAFSTPDAFIYLYSSISGSNVERTIFRENPSSIVDFSINPGTNAFLFKSGATNTVTIDVDNTTPLDVLGSISLGNVGNKYTLPNNNGTPSQYLQTDGTGVASWVDLPVDADHDWYEEGTTNSPNAITDDIFTQGNVAIGNITADYQLDIENSVNRRALSVSSTYSGNFAHYGIYNTLNSNGNTKFGIYQTLSGSGTNTEISYAIANKINFSGDQRQNGVYNDVVGSGLNFIGFSNIIASSSNYTNLSRGVYNVFGNSDTEFIMGINNEFSSSNTSNTTGYKIGMLNNFEGAGFSASGLYGTFNYIPNTTNTQDKYGTYTLIDQNGSGTHYGIYSDVTKSTGYAGYFLGRMSIGTTTANNYILPASRGGLNQIMQTNLFGIVSWVDSASVGADAHDWYAEGTTTAPTAITDDIFTQGNVAIGKNVAQYSLEIQTSGDRAVSTTINGTDNNGKYGNRNLITNTGNGEHYGTYNALLDSGSGNRYGTYNSVDGTGTGSQYGSLQRISNTGNGVHYGSQNMLSGSGTGNHYGSRSILSGTGTGYQYGSKQEINNEGDGNHYGFHSQLQGTGSGDKYGSYNLINTLSGGTHYGVYSSVTKSTGYAGYFVGRISIGTSVSNSNYILPLSRGTANQIMQTDGSGNVTWVNTSTINTDEQTIDTFNFNNTSNILTLEIENDGIVAQTVDLSSLSNTWKLTGNSGTNTATNFIGTTDNVNLSIKTNNVERILVKTDGTTEIKNELIINSIATGTEHATILNDDNYSHTTDNNLDFGTGGSDYIIASQQNTSESAGLHGDGDSNTLWSPGDGNRQLRILDEDNWSDNDGNPYNNNAEVGYIDATGQYLQASDKNRKQDIKKLEDALSKIEQLNGYTYQFKINAEERQKGQKNKTTSGVIAQELYEVLPEAVEITEYGEYFVHYAGITPLLIEGIKELKKENDQLKEKQKTLEERLAKIEALLQNKN